MLNPMHPNKVRQAAQVLTNPASSVQDLKNTIIDLIGTTDLMWQLANILQRRLRTEQNILLSREECLRQLHRQLFYEKRVV